MSVDTKYSSYLKSISKLFEASLSFVFQNQIPKKILESLKLLPKALKEFAFTKSTNEIPDLSNLLPSYKEQNSGCKYEIPNSGSFKSTHPKPFNPFKISRRSTDTDLSVYSSWDKSQLTFSLSSSLGTGIWPIENSQLLTLASSEVLESSQLFFGLEENKQLRGKRLCRYK